MSDLDWNDEQVTILKKLWLEGLSASQIAKQLEGVTRNAVLGKVHRLGLSGRAQPSQPSRSVSRPASHPSVSSQRSKRAPIQRVTPPPVEIDEPPGSAVLLTLGAHMCKWPIGHPESENFSFCGRVASNEGPYCVDHARVAYQPPTKKRSGGEDLARALRRYV